jgi:propionaldehyde dehydrogenase
VVVDETADLDHAAQCIIRGASFSNCTPCSSEKEIFVVDSVADKLKSLLVNYGAYELSKAHEGALLKEIFKEIRPGRVPSVINMDYIGKPPHVILKRAIDLDVPPETKIAILEADKDHPLIWTEQIMPILPFVRCRNAKEAMTMGVAAEQGLRHTIVFHSNDLENLAYMSSIADASQFVKNASSIGGIGVEGEGFKSLHIATGGEGLVRPRVYSLIRRCVLTDDFRYRFGIEADTSSQ